MRAHTLFVNHVKRDKRESTVAGLCRASAGFVHLRSEAVADAWVLTCFLWLGFWQCSCFSGALKPEASEYRSRLGYSTKRSSFPFSGTPKRPIMFRDPWPGAEMLGPPWMEAGWMSPLGRTASGQTEAPVGFLGTILLSGFDLLCCKS